MLVVWVAVADGPALLPLGRTGLNGLDFEVEVSLGGIVMLLGLMG